MHKKTRSYNQTEHRVFKVIEMRRVNFCKRNKIM